jgi:hypothetical protein
LGDSRSPDPWVWGLPLPKSPANAKRWGAAAPQPRGSGGREPPNIQLRSRFKPGAFVVSLLQGGWSGGAASRGSPLSGHPRGITALGLIQSGRCFLHPARQSGGVFDRPSIIRYNLSDRTSALACFSSAFLSEGFRWVFHQFQDQCSWEPSSAPVRR